MHPLSLSSRRVSPGSTCLKPLPALGSQTHPLDLPHQLQPTLCTGSLALLPLPWPSLAPAPLTPQGYFGGYLPAHVPWEPAGCRSASGSFGGGEVVSGWGGDPAAQLPPPFLSPGRMSSPQGHPGGILARTEQSVEQVSEVRGKGGQQVLGGASLPGSSGSARPPLCCSSWDAVQHQGEVCPNSTFVPLRSQAGPCRSRLCTLGTVTRVKKVGEPPSHIPAGSP